jgi:hypothetical protein
VVWVQAGKCLDERRLTGTVLADQAVKLACADIEADAVENGGAPEPFAQVRNMEPYAPVI